MKWDIDKALSKLEASSIAGTTISRVLVDYENAATLEKLGLKAPRSKKSKAWCVGLGLLHTPKLFFHGWTIHEAYLKCRKAVRELSAESLQFYGLTKPTKRSNSFNTARKRK